MELKDEPILVVGAGITGLSLAYWLRQQGHKVTLVEASATAGGVMATCHVDGFELNEGPVSCALTPLIVQLANELNIETEHPARVSSQRFIYTSGKMQRVSPLTMFTGSLLSLRGRFALFRDLFCKASDEPRDESIAEFARRHFGEEAHQKLLAPVMSGIYAGDTERLSMKYGLPKVAQLARKHGSLLKAFCKEGSGSRKIISFKGGLVQLANALEEKVKADIRYSSRVSSFTCGNQGYEVTIQQGDEFTTETFHKIYFAIPAYALADIVHPHDSMLGQQLISIQYASVSQVYYATEKTGFEGFGFLIPPKDGFALLGAIHHSGIFPGKARPDKALHVAFTNHILNAEPELITTLSKELTLAVGAKDVTHLHTKVWSKAIPQFHVGYGEVIDAVNNFETTHPGIHILGNFISGVSVGDCITAAHQLAYKK